MTTRDKKLIVRLDRRNRRWRDRFDDVEDRYGSRLRRLFEAFVLAKGNLVMGAFSRLHTDENRIIENSGENMAIMSRLLFSVRELYRDRFGPGGPYDKIMSSGYRLANARGIQKALDIVRIASPASLPRKGYRAAGSRRLITAARRMSLSSVHQIETMDLTVLRRTFMGRLTDANGMPEMLRRDLLKTGQINHMLDSAGRVVTASERADRIARTEFSQLARESHDAAITDFYYKGQAQPNDTWYMWFNPVDDRSQASHAARNGLILTASEWDRRDFGDGRTGREPLRTRCRCSTSFVDPVWFAPATRKEMFKKSGPAFRFDVDKEAA